MNKYLLPALAIAFFSSCKTGNSTIAISNSVTDTALIENATTATVKPAESIFVLPDTFTTQRNKRFVLNALEGKPTVVGMVFTHCGYACPRLTFDMKSIADNLKENRDKVNFVLVTFDTERDTPAQLKKFQEQMGLDANWILLHGSDETVRTLSVLLNVQFEKDAEGNFSHSNLISVLDKKGALAFQKEGLEADHTETLEKITQLINH